MPRPAHGRHHDPAPAAPGAPACRPGRSHRPRRRRAGATSSSRRGARRLRAAPPPTALVPRPRARATGDDARDEPHDRRAEEGSHRRHGRRDDRRGPSRRGARGRPRAPTAASRRALHLHACGHCMGVPSTLAAFPAHLDGVAPPDRRPAPVATGRCADAPAPHAPTMHNRASAHDDRPGRGWSEWRDPATSSSSSPRSTRKPRSPPSSRAVRAVVPGRGCPRRRRPLDRRHRPSSSRRRCRRGPACRSPWASAERCAPGTRTRCGTATRSSSRSTATGSTTPGTSPSSWRPWPTTTSSSAHASPVGTRTPSAPPAGSRCRRSPGSCPASCGPGSPT